MVALAFDRGYAAPAAALIRSCLLRHRGEELRFELIHDGSLSAEDLRHFEAMSKVEGAEIGFHMVDEHRLGGLPRVDRFGPIVWARIFLPELLGEHARAIYLDCDILVFSPLRQLWSSGLAGCALGAVANVVEPGAREHVRRLGVSYPGGFFNSGVLLMDLERMRAECSTGNLSRFLIDYGDRLVWPDQDALNVIFAGGWLPLHPRWNAQNSFWSWRGWAAEVFDPGELADAIRNPAVRHFEGPSVAKPWHYLCPAPHKEHYRELVAQTPWAARPLDDRTVSTMLISLLPGRWRLKAYGRMVRARDSLRARWRPSPNA